MIRRPPISTRIDTLFPYTTLFRSTQDYAACLCRTADFCGSAMPKFGIVRAFATVAVVSDFVGCSTGAYPVDVTANRLFPRGEVITLAGSVRVSRRLHACLCAPPRGVRKSVV